jgi:hypothetical protein
MNRHRQRPALEILEEAVHLLRGRGLFLLAPYLIGTLPFIVTLLFFWSEMAFSAFARDQAVPGSLFVALAFIWMNCWQTVFTVHIRAKISASALPQWTPAKMLRVFVVQSSIQPMSLIVLPCAAVVGIPFAWAYAFYQNVTCLGDGETASVRSVAAMARRRSMWEAKQNWMIIAIALVVALFTVINIATSVVTMAQLLNSIFGVETALSRSPTSIINSTSFATLFALTYLLIDPVLKTAYTLRCFYGDSVNTGEDLHTDLRAIATTAALLIILFFVPVMAHAEATAPLPAKQLDSAMDRVIHQPEYSWRLPRQAPPSDNKTALVRFAERVVAGLEAFARFCVKGATAFFRWLRDFLEDPADPTGSGKGRPQAGRMRWLLILLSALILAIILAFALRVWKRNKPTVTLTGEAIAIPVNIADESVSAAQLPEDEWTRLAKQLLAQGDIRLAIRALFLAVLAGLGQRGLISLAQFKTNHEYEVELRRRARTSLTLIPQFAESIHLYERTWYGHHPANDAAINHLLNYLQELRK